MIKKSRKKQMFALLAFSIMSATISIIHGIFFDLNFSEINRLSITGIVFTWVIIFPSFILLEWVFDLDNYEELKKIEKRLDEMQKELNKEKK